LKLRAAIDGTLRDDRVHTGDLGGQATTRDMTQAIVRRLSKT
jgi:isocitrate/isopropylmalate dehydrogenase